MAGVDLGYTSIAQSSKWSHWLGVPVRTVELACHLPTQQPCNQIWHSLTLGWDLKHAVDLLGCLYLELSHC